ncbi:MAG: protein kinase domain-containing protein [Phycisphaerales bacterium]
MTTPVPPFRTERVKEILDLALERPAHERDAFVAGMCGDDDALRVEVLSLLRSLDSVGAILEPGAPAPAAPPEPLTGLRFGPYRVAERVGEGGMGVVYRAEDTRLGRVVAVKALPAHLAADPHRRARFEHEARLLAAMSHPNIEAIYGVEDTPRGPVMVLEFVAGESLARRLARGALPIDDATAAARHILRALEASHAAGITHRDLKPANIHVLPDGGLKVLDFGIATLGLVPVIGASPSTPNGSPVFVTSSMGLLGTASYMSPEQARGKPVDRRADLWAFGCVFFEMLTGRRAFEGETLSDTLAAVLRAEPDWSRLPAHTPAPARALIRRCLEKDPDLRRRDAGDARLELERAPADAEHPGLRPNRARRAVAPAFVAGAAVVSLAAWVTWPRAVAPPARPVRFELRTAPDAPVNASSSGSLAVSPDGSTLVYTGGYEDNRRLLARQLDSFEWIELAGTENSVAPFFSPDGAWIGFASGSRIMRVPTGGGGAEVICDGQLSFTGAAWAENGSLVLAGSGGGIDILPPGGERRALTRPDLPTSHLHLHPSCVPGSDAVLFTDCDYSTSSFTGRIEAVRIASGERHTVFEAACWPQVVARGDAGHGARGSDRDALLVFWQAGRILAAPFDRATLRVTGRAEVVATAPTRLESSPMPRYAVSAGVPGVLVYLPGNVTHDFGRLAWFDPDGSTRVITASAQGMDTPRLSPDGGRIAYIDSSVGVGDLWVHDVGRGTTIRLTKTRDAQHPLWTPDGRQILVAARMGSGDSAIWRVDADAARPPEKLWGPIDAYPSSITPDGATILLTMYFRDTSGKDIALLDAASPAQPRNLFTTSEERIWPRLAPDGAMLAYTSMETGTFEVYLHAYPSLAGKTRVSTGGGYRPTWSPDGRLLYYQWLNRIMCVEVEATNPPRVSAPRVVHDHAPDLRFDVARDGRILLPHPTGDWGPQDRINVISGWAGPAGDPVP